MQGRNTCRCPDCLKSSAQRVARDRFESKPALRNSFPSPGTVQACHDRAGQNVYEEEVNNRIIKYACDRRIQDLNRTNPNTM
ncbi:hypothetical protein RRG08_040187 [Elysia crispata]|uniref:Uncharacterized protein n=1 Tax=Elysia crispata TaxID=231223 RepID=A0AAE0XWL7_9GAST|nr:hypothetical protein RRG08_040187 [Elysia crispata]